MIIHKKAKSIEKIKCNFIIIYLEEITSNLIKTCMRICLVLVALA